MKRNLQNEVNEKTDPRNSCEMQPFRAHIIQLSKLPSWSILTILLVTLPLRIVFTQVNDFSFNSDTISISSEPDYPPFCFVNKEWPLCNVSFTGMVERCGQLGIPAKVQPFIFLCHRYYQLVLCFIYLIRI